MKKALPIGRAAGIGIYLHWTFLLLLAGIFALYLVGGQGVTAALFGVAQLAAIFGCVVLHELGHALMARRFGVPTRHITLYPIGGIARLQRIPEEPMQEFWIAIAGPAVNVVIAALLYGVLVALGAPLSYEVLAEPGRGFFTTLMWVNVILVAFNLLPAFPMDGGRVLRALLATRIDYARATEIAANVGQFMAILFGLVGLVTGNFILLFIALFVYLGAQQEAKQATMRALTEGLTVREAMMTRFHALAPDAPLDDAIDELLAGQDTDFPILQDGRIVGVLTRKAIMKGLAQGGRAARVGDVAEPVPAPVEDTTMLVEAFAQMQQQGSSVVPVTRRGQLVGLLSLENVGELMMVSAALRQRRP